MLSNSQKRMLRNTAMLYARMVLVMVVTLYTSRVVLEVLGAEDFGIYHVVAGFVALLGFMQGAMTSATQRYFAFDLGESGGNDLSRMLNTSLVIHGLLALLVALVAETAGYWFVVTQLTIPDERAFAALWVYHIAIASFAISVVTVPFTAMLMAHERMGVFAAIGMLDVILKLAAVILLKFIGGDKLIAYGFLLLVVNFITLSLYVGSNKLSFPHIKLRWRWPSSQFRTMLSYTAWNVWGNLAAALSVQGSNVLLNIFFGPTVNAGKSISAQANGALNNFVVNVQAAINPQIIKLYASGDKLAMHSLVLHASKYNFFILYALSLPVLFNTNAILSFWLVKVPPYAAIFLQLSIIVSLIAALSGPLRTSAQATGVIKLYQTVIGGIQLLNIPVSYIVLLHWKQPELVLVVAVCLSMLAFIARLLILKKLTKLDIKVYTQKVLLRSMATVLITAALIRAADFSGADDLAPLLINISGAFFIASLGIFVFGLGPAERKLAVNALRQLRKI